MSSDIANVFCAMDTNHTSYHSNSANGPHPAANACSKDAPLVSVCMPMYNASAYLRECIDSILCQTFGDFELLIADDGSTDESRYIVRSYDDPRIRLIENEHDYIGSLNLLLKEARGKYIARMDADDIMVSFRLEAQFGYMERHVEVDVLGGIAPNAASGSPNASCMNEPCNNTDCRNINCGNGECINYRCRNNICYNVTEEPPVSSTTTQALSTASVMLGFI